MYDKRTCYTIREADGKGEGVYATRAIAPYEVIMVGRIKEELKANNSHAAQIDLDRYVIFHGDIALVNHSCDPNAGIKLNETGGHDYVARRAIAEGEEICVDYAMRNYSVDHFPYDCRCGAAQCRGKITGWKGLPVDLKVAYAGFVAPYLLKLELLAAARARREPLAKAS